MVIGEPPCQSRPLDCVQLCDDLRSSNCNESYTRCVITGGGAQRRTDRWQEVVVAVDFSISPCLARTAKPSVPDTERENLKGYRRLRRKRVGWAGVSRLCALHPVHAVWRSLQLGQDRLGLLCSECQRCWHPSPTTRTRLVCACGRGAVCSQGRRGGECCRLQRQIHPLIIQINPLIIQITFLNRLSRLDLPPSHGITSRRFKTCSRAF